MKEQYLLFFCVEFKGSPL